MKTIQQKCQVVLLPTDNHNTIIYKLNDKVVLDRGQDTKHTPVPQYLYILSGEEIKEGDWYLATFYGISGSYQAPCQFIVGDKPCEEIVLGKKIIATTNPKLHIKYLEGNDKGSYQDNGGYIWDIAKPTDQFIKDWIAKGCPEFVNVEYEEKYVGKCVPDKNGCHCYQTLPVISQDNTITCSFIEDDNWDSVVKEIFENGFNKSELLMRNYLNTNFNPPTKKN